jgi:hypothetical protein
VFIKKTNLPEFPLFKKRNSKLTFEINLKIMHSSKVPDYQGCNLEWPRIKQWGTV